MDSKITVRVAGEGDIDQIIGLAKQLSETVIISEAYIATNFKPSWIMDSTVYWWRSKANQLLVMRWDISITQYMLAGWWRT